MKWVFLVRKAKEKPIYATGQNFRAPFTAKKLKNTMNFFKVLVFFSFPTRNNILRAGSNVKGIFWLLIWWMFQKQSMYFLNKNIQYSRLFATYFGVNDLLFGWVFFPLDVWFEELWLKCIFFLLTFCFYSSN